MLSEVGVLMALYAIRGGCTYDIVCSQGWVYLWHCMLLEAGVLMALYAIIGECTYDIVCSEVGVFMASYALRDGCIDSYSLRMLSDIFTV